MLSQRNISTKRKAKIMDRDNWKCYICGNEKCALEIHHIVPVFLGGSDHDKNLISLCHSCHMSIHKENIDKCVENAIIVCLTEQQKRKQKSSK